MERMVQIRTTEMLVKLGGLWEGRKEICFGGCGFRNASPNSSMRKAPDVPPQVPKKKKPISLIEWLGGCRAKRKWLIKRSFGLVCLKCALGLQRFEYLFDTSEIHVLSLSKIMPHSKSWSSQQKCGASGHVTECRAWEWWADIGQFETCA